MKSYVIVGAGVRVYGMFVLGLKSKLGSDVKISGVYDINRKRCEFYQSEIDGLKIYSDFDLMLDCEKPDAVIVGTIDSVHHEYVVRALDKGYDVICEKPLTNTYEGAQAIREAEKRSGKLVRVTFNCRFMPTFAKVKELVCSGAIGKIYAVNYNYCLNRWHGGDYFKRWHREMRNSQGMLLHKSTHHFDIVNWLLDDEPLTVCAMANRVYYGNPEKSYAERCSRCERHGDCQSYKSQSAPIDKALYFDCESEDGSIRDKCAFLPDTDIYDNMSVSVTYRRGAILSYSLNLFSMREGYDLTLTGEDGVILVSCYQTGAGENVEIRIMNRENEIKTVNFEHGGGTHSGGDSRLLNMIFSGENKDDPLGQLANSFDGISSAIIGIGANDSIKNGKTVNVGKMLDSLR